MRKLILHIGTHKTGTTSIQQMLHISREWFASRKYHYFREYNKVGDLSPEQHHLAMDFALGDECVLDCAIEKLERAAPNGESVIVSSESMYRDLLGVRQWDVLNVSRPFELRAQYLRRLSKALANFEVCIVVAFRRPDEFAEALYKTLIWGAHTKLTWMDYLNAAQYLFQYDKQLFLFMEFFSDVRVIEYDGRSMCEKFAQTIGCPMPALPEWRLNVSQDARLILWMAQMNKEAKPSKKERAVQRSFCDSQFAQSLLQAEECVSFWRNGAERAAFCDRVLGSFSAISFDAVEDEANKPAQLDQGEFVRIRTEYEAWRQRGHGQDS